MTAAVCARASTGKRASTRAKFAMRKVGCHGHGGLGGPLGLSSSSVKSANVTLDEHTMIARIWPSVVEKKRRITRASLENDVALEGIAVRAHGAYGFVERIVAAELAAQAADEQIDRARGDREILAAREGDQLFAREHLARVAAEHQQQVGFRARERNAQARGRAHETPVRIERVPRERGHELGAGVARGVAGRGALAGLGGLRAARRTPQGGTDAREQFAQIEGLGDVVVGAEFEADHLVGGLDERGQHDDARTARGAQTAAQLQPVHARQHHVEQHQLDALLREHRETLFGAPGQPRAIAFAAQELSQRRTDVGVVFDDENGNVVQGRAAAERRVEFAFIVR
ncbi:hypothetical protein PT2222_70310 [Paraburkholderia tropica]